MELGFLELTSWKLSKNSYLEHITELVIVSLDKGDTYNSLFTKLQNISSFTPEKKQAVEDWIQFNKDEQDDHDVFNTVIAYESGLYATFNLRSS